jgi:hypothetical protein
VSNLGEADADAFFQKGDEGTYLGGPADSMVPVGLVDAEETRELLGLPTPEQIQRRERLQRIVTTIVGSLGVASVLVFALRLGQHPAHDVAIARNTTAAVVPGGEAHPARGHVTPAPEVQAIAPEAAARALAATQVEPASAAGQVEPSSAAAAPVAEEPKLAAQPASAAVPARSDTTLANTGTSPRSTSIETSSVKVTSVAKSRPSAAISPVIAGHTVQATMPTLRSHASPAPAQASPGGGTHAPPSASFASFPD